MGRPHKCPYCGLCDTVAKGYRRTKTIGARKIRLCRSCRRKFTPKKQKPVQEARTASSERTEAADAAPAQAEWTS